MKSTTAFFDPLSDMYINKIIHVAKIPITIEQIGQHLIKKIRTNAKIDPTIA